MNDSNPCEPAVSSEDNSHHLVDSSLIRGNEIYVVWGVLFIVNIFIPVLFGLSATTERGRSGMAIAIVVLFFAGFLVCAKDRKFGVYLIIGGIAVGLAQLYPIPQFVAGLVALEMGRLLGLANTDADVTSEFGGFIITMITGTILLAMSAGCGLLVQQLVIHRR